MFMLLTHHGSARLKMTRGLVEHKPEFEQPIAFDQAAYRKILASTHPKAIRMIVLDLVKGDTASLANFLGAHDYLLAIGHMTEHDSEHK